MPKMSKRKGDGGKISIFQKADYTNLIAQAERAVTKSFIAVSCEEPSTPVPGETRDAIVKIIEGFAPKTAAESLLAVQIAVAHVVALDEVRHGDKRIGLLFMRHSCDAMQMIDRGRNAISEVSVNPIFRKVSCAG